MNIQIFGKSKCFDSKKAERYFKERRIKYQFIDLPRYGLRRRAPRAPVGVPGQHKDACGEKREAGHGGLLPGGLENLGVN